MEKTPKTLKSQSEEELKEAIEAEQWKIFLKDLSGENLKKETSNQNLLFKNENFINDFRRDQYLQNVKKNFLKTLNPSVPNKMLFITFNFKDDQILKLGITNITTLMEKILNKRCFQKKEYYYNIEQRSEILNEYKGFHIHLLIERPKKSPSHLQRELYTALKQFVGNSKHIDIRYYNGCDIWREKIQYLYGEKEDFNKNLKTLNDKYFRTKFHLKKIYTSF